ncbi:SDR family oxidoreductase [Dactylosporangium sp. AC04546]|uniref:SDR family NAD(P)-dependent oxidoreductase n=1 Tax=Dactylosporangium sp. AC04546 TaxID=2862460 RepID=UPI001EDE5BA1|nr:SDR family oxidoreductase [Dactylosporangium sp. AC04546]WVK86971.1 SDR family oxidoreductase [Dactylosporangium sp. AC04546]
MSLAVVTGAGHGLGQETARLLAARGHSIVAVDIDGDSAIQVAKDVGGRGFACDVADRDAVRALAARVGPIDILVNNAGIWRFGPLLELSHADVMDVVNVNLLGTLWCVQAFVPGMAGRGGSVINLSSGAARMHSAGTGIYPTTKNAIEALTIQLAVELGPQGVRVNAVAPGSILTEATARILSDSDRAERERTIPRGRLGQPSDVAEAVAYLASDAADYVTGQILYVDGGLTSGRVTSR